MIRTGYRRAAPAILLLLLAAFLLRIPPAQGRYSSLLIGTVHLKPAPAVSAGEAPPAPFQWEVSSPFVDWDGGERELPLCLWNRSGGNAPREAIPLSLSGENSGAEYFSLVLPEESLLLPGDVDSEALCSLRLAPTGIQPPEGAVFPLILTARAPGGEEAVIELHIRYAGTSGTESNPEAGVPASSGESVP